MLGLIALPTVHVPATARRLRSGVWAVSYRCPECGATHDLSGGIGETPVLRSRSFRPECQAVVPGIGIRVALELPVEQGRGP